MVLIQEDVLQICNMIYFDNSDYGTHHFEYFGYFDVDWSGTWSVENVGQVVNIQWT